MYYLLSLVESFVSIMLLQSQTSPEAEASESNAAIDPIYEALDIIGPVALGMVLLVGVIYSVIIGVQYSKAEDSAKRDEAKKKIVNAIIGFGVALVLIGILYAIRKPIGDFIVGQ